MAGLERLIATVIKEKAPDLFGKIRVFNTTWNSYEEWLNWELFLALHEQEGLSVEPRPRLEDNDLKMFADLKVSSASETAIIEVKIAHSGTQDKYIDAVRKDANTLAALTDPQPHKLLLLFLSSNEAPIKDDPEWQRWLAEFGDPEKVLYYQPRDPQKGSDAIYLFDFTSQPLKSHT